MSSNNRMFNPAVGRPNLHLSASGSSPAGSEYNHARQEHQHQHRRPFGNVTNTQLPLSASMEWKHHKQHPSLHKQQSAMLGYLPHVPSLPNHPHRPQDPLAFGKYKARFDPFGAPPLIPHVDQQHHQYTQVHQTQLPQQVVASTDGVMSSSSLVLPGTSSSHSSMLRVEGSTTVTPPGTDPQATHHLYVANLRSENDVRAVFRLVQSSGQTKTVYSDLLHSSGILMVTFYDLREAAFALEALESFISSEYQEGVIATYISDVRFAQLSNTPPQDSRCARTVTLTLCGAHNRLVEFNYKEFFDTWGATRSMTGMEFSGSRRTIEVEYFDQRVASQVTAELHNHAYQGISFHVCSAWLGATSGIAFTPPDAGLFDSPTSRFSSSPASYFTFTDTSASGAVHARQQSANEQLLLTTEHRPHHLPPSSSAFRLFHPEHQHHHLQPTSASLPAALMIAPSNVSPGSNPAATSPFSLFSSVQPFGFEEQRHPIQPCSSTLERGSGDSSSSSHEAMSTARELVGEHIHRPLATSRGPSVSASSSSLQSQDNTFSIERVRNGSDTRTTFMIRNIPNKYTQLSPPIDL
ncbi:hypothetical protein BDB00DRAFT_792847 [Zychaea mexicana]|uniref:uncharacterized protein n=1 Tax=Zychaea mexicana TaxID=64656 RepID=UPI0022FE59BA|nr:uncharacterized protein BDB00DRAFT_792847 [Zychaea mexicana]KAI9484470.1 hypothetical protein BDB00DRAFT_792847 [Zychaea mexicana]